MSLLHGLALLTSCAAPRAAPSSMRDPMADASPPPPVEARVLDQDPELAHWSLRQRVGPGTGPIRPPTEAWRVATAAPVTAPLAVGPTGVWVTAGGEVLLLAHNGAIQMRAALDASTAVSPMDGDPTVGTATGGLFAFDPETGRIQLSWPGSARARAAAVPVGQAAIWTTTDGAIHSTIHGTVAHLPSTTAELASDSERAYIQSQSGLVAAVSPEALAWRVRTPGRGVGPPLLCCGRLFVAYDLGSGGGGVLALDPATGAQAWQVELPVPPSAGMALAGQRLLVPQADGGLVALATADGASIWTVRAGPDRISVPPLVAGESAWVGDVGGRLSRVDLSDGGIAWHHDLGSPITAGPELAWDLMIVGLASGEVVALETRP